MVLNTDDFLVLSNQANVYRISVDTVTWVVTVDLLYKHWMNQDTGRIDVVSPSHKHRQNTILSAVGSHDEDGPTWSTLNDESLFNTINDLCGEVGNSTWGQDLFRGNSNVTEDLASIVKLVEELSKKVKPLTEIDFSKDFNVVPAQTVDISSTNEPDILGDNPFNYAQVNVVPGYHDYQVGLNVSAEESEEIEGSEEPE